jgi:small-conductance mechanosensitive channel
MKIAASGSGVQQALFLVWKAWGLLHARFRSPCGVYGGGFMREWWLETTILSIPVWNWLVALAVISGVFFALVTLRRYVRARVDGRSGSEGTFARILLRAAASTSVLAMLALSILLGVKFLELPLAWQSGISQLWFVAVVLQVALWMNSVVTYGLERYLERHAEANSVTMTLIGFSARAVLWTVAVLAILDNMGINITAFVASLGIGGVAVALAAQVVLSDLFASISIGLDKPFELGDFIVVGGIAGNIEHVGLKTTRIRSLGGEQIVCSNTELLKQTIQNYKRMDLRRIAFTFSVAYGASAKDAEELPATVRQLIEGMEGTRFDRAHLLALGERGLEYEVVYYVLSADYNRYMDIQQAINLGIMRELEQRGMQFGRREMQVHYSRPPGEEDASGMSERGVDFRRGVSKGARPL